jgi:uncharacterized cupredoxin-like copper-binding protein
VTRVARAIPLLLLVAATSCSGATKFGNGPVRIEGNDRLRFKPDSITIASGKHRFVFANVGGLTHDLRSTKSVPGGQSVSFEYTLQTGTYEFVCRVDNHDQAGMRAKLIVK